MKHSFSKRAFIAAGGAILLAAAAAAAYASFGKPSSAQGPSGMQPGPLSKVAAVVNGQDIYESELAGAMQQGVDRAVAIDRYVNKALAAQLAEKAYGKEAEEALRGAQREVLSQLYVVKKAQDLREAVTEADVKAYYEANVKAEDYAGYRVKFAVAQEQKDAEDIAVAIAAGKAKDVEARFKLAKEGGDGFVMAPELPYGLGAIVRGLKKGEYSKPVVLRNGFFILYLEDTKTNPRPELAKVSEEIRSLLVQKRLNDELMAARSAARVELR